MVAASETESLGALQAVARPIWRRALDLVFGYDFFISYAWADGTAYAEKLAHVLSASGFEVFLDRNDYRSGDDWKQVGAWTLRRTGQLILIGSPAATRSAAVAREVEIFRATGRRIIPIDFDRSLDAALIGSDLARHLPEKFIRVHEPGESMLHGPTPDTLAALRRTFDLTRQDKKRVMAFALAVAVLTLLTVAAVVFAINAYAQNRLALGRSLAVTAESLVNEGPGNRDVLAALVVEALKRLPQHEAEALAASEVALTIGKKFSANGAESVEFIRGKSELATTGPSGLSLIDLDQGSARTLDDKIFGGTETSSSNLTFNEISSSGRYLVVRTSGGPAYIVDTLSLRTSPIPSSQFAKELKLSSDERRVFFVVEGVSGGDHSQLSVFNIASNSEQQFDLGNYTGPYEISYFDNDLILLLSWQRIFVLRKQSYEAQFDIPPGLATKSLTSDGTNAFFVLQTSPYVQQAKAFPREVYESEGAGGSPSNSGAMRTTGVYKLDLESGVITEIAGLSDALEVAVTQDKSNLIVAQKSGVSIIDIRSDSKHFFANTSPMDECPCEITLNARWGGVKEGTGWHFIDLRTLTDWHVAQGSPQTLKLSRKSTQAVALGGNGLAGVVLIDLDKRTVLSRINVGFDANKVAISDTGDLVALLLAGNPDADGVVMRLDPARLRAELCAEPGQNFDRVSWNHYLPGKTWEPTCSGWK